MGVTLVDAIKTSEDNLQRSIVEKFVETSPIMGLIPFGLAPQLRKRYSQESVLPTVGFRAQGAAYTASQAVYEESEIQLKFLGGQIDIDRKIAPIISYDGADQYSKQFKAILKSAALTAKKFLINGSIANSVTEFDGLKRIVAAMDSAQTISMGDNGSTIATLTMPVMIQRIDSALNACLGLPDFGLTNRTILSQLWALATTGASNSTYANLFTYEVTEVLPGIKTRHLRYQGIPIYAVDEDSTGTAVMGFNETQGSSSVASSIYFVKFGEEYLEPLQDLPSGPEMFMYEDASGKHVGIDWAMGLKPGHPRCVSKIAGILASS